MEDQILNALYDWNRNPQAAGVPMSPALLERMFGSGADRDDISPWGSVGLLLKECSIEWSQLPKPDGEYLDGLQITRSGLRFVRR